MFSSVYIDHIYYHNTGTALGQCSDRSNQSNNFHHVYFRFLGTGYLSFILDNHLWCTTFCEYHFEDKAITVFEYSIRFVTYFHLNDAATITSPEFENRAIG